MYVLCNVHKKNVYEGAIVVFHSDLWVGRHDNANTVATFHSYFANTLQNSVATWSKLSQPFFFNSSLVKTV
jgi:hypothetical protein